MKGTSAKEENERLRRDRKGADSAEGRKLNARGSKLQCEGVKQGLRGEIKSTKAEENEMLRWERKGGYSAKGQHKMQVTQGENKIMRGKSQCERKMKDYWGK